MDKRDFVNYLTGKPLPATRPPQSEFTKRQESKEKKKARRKRKRAARAKQARKAKQPR